MRKTFAPGVGGVVSADIAVPEHEREVSFYSSVLTTGEDPLWRDDLMNNQGAPVIGLGVRTPEYESLPMQWMPHIQVADIATSAKRAVELGGQEIMHGKDDGGVSQWAVLVDPDGAAFGIIPVVPDDAVSTDENIGCISSLKLYLPAPEPAQDFYRQVVGWSSAEAVSAGEICPADGENAALPPVWLIGLPVADLQASLRRARAGGGEVIQETSAAGYAGAVIQDPVGVYFALEQA